MTNIQDVETRVTIGDSVTLNGTKCGCSHGYQKRDRKIHCRTSSNMSVIAGPYANLFNMKQALQKSFQ